MESSFCPSNLAAAVALYTLLHALILVLYRLFLSPIAAFPGPILARVTFLYEFYYDFVRDGQYYRRIGEMHEKYGPIVRVTPEELHIRDAEYYNTLYVPYDDRKTNGYFRSSLGVGFDDILKPSVSHDLHRIVKSRVSLSFTTSAILPAEAKVLAKVKTLCERLNCLVGTDTPVHLSNAFRSLSMGGCHPFFSLSKKFRDLSWFGNWPDVGNNWSNLRLSQAKVTFLGEVEYREHNKIPPPGAILIFLYPLLTLTVAQQSRQEILACKAQHKDESKAHSFVTALDGLVHDNAVQAVLGEKGIYHLAQVIQQGGTYNPSYCLIIVVFSLLRDEEKQEKLRNALQPLFAQDPKRDPSWQELEKVPYLAGCVKEALRLGAAGLTRLARVAPGVELRYGDWVIPKGTPASMTQYWMHVDPDVFSNPHAFEPTRWMVDPEKLRVMRRYFMPFSRGSRSCPGRNVGLMAINHTIAQLFRPGAPRMLLHDTDESDITACRGFVTPLPAASSGGLRVILRESPTKGE
ncbi:hypothetical protein AJ80_02347 [Polytolypa hystricis UAMH7299]|uniref:Cytochrome P450 oxidoreductase n=1 Tax=Polytolypa hystricis (strain UAMH7299) TaxID=1447883 RepID=A0A2B7YSH3_POLH7|nr:hypothetical protein AJ80_02347 [Polytolypa hystricis UAMH7299]